MKNVRKEIINTQNKLFDVKPLHWTVIKLVTNSYLTRFEKEITERHAKKLSALGINMYTHVDSNFVNKKRNRVDKVEEFVDKETVFNLSSRKLTEIELRVLSKGLKYGIKSKRINKFEILSRFEMLAQSLNRFPLK